MGLLDGGLQGIFGAAFAPLYLAGTLHRIGKDAEGQVVTPVTWTDVPIRAQQDELSDQQRRDWGIPSRGVLLIVLQAGVAAEPTDDDEITVAGQRWRISHIERDPAQAAWTMAGQPA
ncbi:hypothetical protein [Inquilinus sp.]|uniref:hypothetical protein n=1 Tax=Inquilinus sp. TaxID=1932117 RepID=UPI0031E3B8AA